MTDETHDFPEPDPDLARRFASLLSRHFLRDARADVLQCSCGEVLGTQYGMSAHVGRELALGVAVREQKTAAELDRLRRRGNGEKHALEPCADCGHQQHGEQCRELVMPGPPGDVDECGCEPRVPVLLTPEELDRLDVPPVRRAPAPGPVVQQPESGHAPAPLAARRPDLAVRAAGEGGTAMSTPEHRVPVWLTPEELNQLEVTLLTESIVDDWYGLRGLERPRGRAGLPARVLHAVQAAKAADDDSPATRARRSVPENPRPLCRDFVPKDAPSQFWCAVCGWNRPMHGSEASRSAVDAELDRLEGVRP